MLEPNSPLTSLVSIALRLLFKHNLHILLTVHQPFHLPFTFPFKSLSLGAVDRIRTCDPHLGKVMLYQLSYYCI